MFCKFCGSQIDENSVFCQKCGKAVGETRAVSPEPQQAVASKKSETGKYITEAKFNPSGMIGLQVLWTIFLSISIIVLIVTNTTKSYRGFINLDNKDFFITCGIITMITSIIGMISVLVTIAINSDIKCIVYENKLIGKAVQSRWSVTRVDFSLNYDEIDNVEAKERIITITSNGIPYIVAAANIDQANRVVTEIRFRTGKKLGKPVASDRWKCPKCGTINHTNDICRYCDAEKPDSMADSGLNDGNMWQCPDCGKYNQLYVGTCGCGTKKPN